MRKMAVATETSFLSASLLHFQKFHLHKCYLREQKRKKEDVVWEGKREPAENKTTDVSDFQFQSRSLQMALLVNVVMQNML